MIPGKNNYTYTKSILSFRYTCMNKLTFFLLCLSANLAISQSYNTTAGMRLGTEWGLSLKQRVYESWTVEAIMQTNRKKNESALTLLGVDHKAIISRRFNLFFGGGLHFPLQNNENALRKDGFGIVGAGGLEFTFARLNFTWDYIPVFIPSELSFRMQSAMSIRYVIQKRDKFSWEKKNKKTFSLPNFKKNPKK